MYLVSLIMIWTLAIIFVLLGIIAVIKKMEQTKINVLWIISFGVLIAVLLLTNALFPNNRNVPQSAINICNELYIVEDEYALLQDDNNQTQKNFNQYGPQKILKEITRDEAVEYLLKRNRTIAQKYSGKPITEEIKKEILEYARNQ